MWSKTDKRVAQLLKEVTGKCPHDIFSSNEKVADAALATLRGNYVKPKKEDKVSFALGDRVRYRNAT